MEPAPDAARAAADGLHWSGSHIVGIGLDRPAQSTKNWIYFPEPEVPFYRVTYLSNYSPYITPEPDQTLFLTETSRSAHKPEPAGTIVERVVDGLIACKLMDEGDRSLVATTWRCTPENLSRALDDARRRPRQPAALAAVPRHLVAGPVRGLALRDRQHGPLGDAGRRVRRPRPVRRAGDGVDPPWRGSGWGRHPVTPGVQA